MYSLQVIHFSSLTDFSYFLLLAGTFFRYKSLEKSLIYNASISMLNIQNSSNANFLFEGLNQVTVGNIRVQTHYYKENNAVFPLFLFDTIQNVTLKDFNGNVIRGPLFKFNQVLSQSLSNIYLTNTSTSQSLAAINQYLVSIDQTSRANIKNFNVMVSKFIMRNNKLTFKKGFTEMNGINSSYEAGSSSMFFINSKNGE